MFFKQVIAFLSALIISFTCGVTPIVRSTDAKPIPAAEREYRFDRDKLQLGAYCFKKDEHYSELRQWFKDAGLDFTVGLSGQQLTDSDFDWFEENGLGVIAPNTDDYRSIRRDCL